MDPTKFQLDIAKKLSIKSEGDTFLTLAAKIMDYVAPALNEKEESDPTDNQVEYALSLGVYNSGDSRRFVSAKIREELEKRNIAALKKLNIKPGSIVIAKGQYSESEYVVSSIKDNGKVYFKGIGCPQSWAVNIVKVVKS